jgi:anti-anti-sigma factor
MKLSLQSIDQTGCARVSAEGELIWGDFLEAISTNPLEKVLGPNWANKRILLSLEKAEFLDSSAIGWLIETHQRTKATGGKLVLHSAPARIRDVFDLLKLPAVLNLRDDEAAARTFISANGDAKRG